MSDYCASCDRRRRLGRRLECVRYTRRCFSRADIRHLPGLCDLVKQPTDDRTATDYELSDVRRSMSGFRQASETPCAVSLLQRLAKVEIVIRAGRIDNLMEAPGGLNRVIRIG